jgi:ABC-type transport system involved in cytochrome c biogenesis permease subunit
MASRGNGAAAARRRGFLRRREPMTVDLPVIEHATMWLAVIALGMAGTLATFALASVGERSLRTARANHAAAWLLGAALVLLSAGIAARWLRIGHGPFLSMYEVLASSLWSLGLVYIVACGRYPVLWRMATFVLPVLVVMGAWMLSTSAADTHAPATYETPVLWFHVVLGKLFLGCAFVAVGIAGVLLARGAARLRTRLAALPGDGMLDALMWRFMLAALVFESAMLVAGAVWAQDAWGRYWAWDPLEIWALLTWIVLAGAVHARLAWRVTPRGGAMLVLAVFAIAFFTFFGIPFVSIAPHKGAV